MPTPQTAFYLAPDLAIHLKWSAGVATFAQEWQRRLQAAEVSGAQTGEHLVEAASLVLSTVEHLDEYTARALADIHRFSGQLPAPMDKLLVGPLELRVEERQFAVGRQGGSEQVTVNYCFDIVRYRYEAMETTTAIAINLPLPA